MIVNTKTDNLLRDTMRSRIVAGMSNAIKSRVAANIEWLMNRRGVNGNSLAVELEKRGTPVPQPTIFRILSGESRDPRTSSLQPIAEYFGVTVADLRDHDFVSTGYKTEGSLRPGMHSVVSADDTDEPTGAIPYWSAKGSCGGGSLNYEEMAKGHLIKEASFFKKYNLKPENAVAIYADGNSMADFIVDGDIVIFDCSKNEPRSGKIFLIDHPDGLRIKQLRRQVDGSWVLESRNPDKRNFPDELIPEGRGELLKLCGEFVYRQGG